MSTVNTGWLKDKNGDKFAPKTLLSQVMAADGSTLESKMADKADSDHTHDDKYDSKGAAATSLADAKTYADNAAATSLADAKTYADNAANTVKNDLLNGAGAAYDTLKELGDLINENDTAIDALETVAAGKADKEHTHSWDELEDRPFYTKVEFGEILPLTTYTAESLGDFFGTSVMSECPPLYEGLTYEIIYNGTTYQAVGCLHADSGYIYVGNAGIIGLGEDTGEPYCVCYLVDFDWYMIGTDLTAAGEFTLAINGDIENITTLPIEYIPEDYRIQFTTIDWTTNTKTISCTIPFSDLLEIPNEEFASRIYVDNSRAILEAGFVYSNDGSKWVEILYITNEVGRTTRQSKCSINRLVYYGEGNENNSITTVQTLYDYNNPGGHIISSDHSKTYLLKVEANGVLSLLDTSTSTSVNLLTENDLPASVLYTSQSLTDTQKTQARTNIGAASTSDIPTNVLKYTSQTLTDDQKTQARTNIGAASEDHKHNGIYDAFGTAEAYADLVKEELIDGADDSCNTFKKVNDLFTTIDDWSVEMEKEVANKAALEHTHLWEDISDRAFGEIKNNKYTVTNEDITTTLEVTSTFILAYAYLENMTSEFLNDLVYISSNMSGSVTEYNIDDTWSTHVSEDSSGVITLIHNDGDGNQQGSFTYIPSDNYAYTETTIYPKKGWYMTVSANNTFEITMISSSSYIITDLKQLPNKYLAPIEIIGGDTLTWDGDTSGLVGIDALGSGSNSHYLISEITPPVEVLENASITYSNGVIDSSNGSNPFVSDMFGDGKCYAICEAYIFVVYEDTVQEGIQFKKGIYFWDTVSSLTINGYTGFTKEVLKEEYLPDTVALKADIPTDYIPVSQKGAASGVAELDESGKVPSSQLPSYVDDILEYTTMANFPSTGEAGKIYVATTTNKTYRWSGSGYVEVSQSIALGETSATAYRGDRGKIAYQHTTNMENPHNVTAAQIGTLVMSLNSTETTPTENGAIAWTYE